MPISIRALFLIFFTIYSLYGWVYADDKGMEPAIQIQRKYPKIPKSYLLPEEDPLYPQLKDLFQTPNMFDSPKQLRMAGFKVKVGRNSHFMVGAHPSIPGHLIKKFYDDISQREQLKNFIKRIEGARIVRKYIKEHNFKHLIVPKKWLYELPETFFEITRRNFSIPSYVLVVEKMDIYDDWDNPKGKARKNYYHMNKEVLTELCTILHDLGGCDSLPRNQPFTRTGKIAFVDTEHVGQYKDHFLKFIVPALNPELQTYATDLWQQLEEKEKGEN